MAVTAPEEQAAPGAVLVMDGVFLLRPELLAHWDFSIFVKVNFDVALARAVRRYAFMGTPDDIAVRYRTRYWPGQRMYLDQVNPRRAANLVVDKNDPARPSVVAH